MVQYRCLFKRFIPVFLLFFLLLTPDAVFAYIGPGAGFALVTSLFTVLVSFTLAFLTLFTLPVRMLILAFKKRNRFRGAQFQKVVVLGFDGMDPDICEPLMEQGKMPHFSALRERGTYRKLRTTFPALSPVAWSTFATGVSPSRHGIYDFLHRNPNTYLPALSSSRVEGPSRVLNLGRYQIPLTRSRYRFLRKSRSFWTLLGNKGIFSHIIRVPLTFPPEKLYGVLLSAMCTPDLRGTQGSFTYFSSRNEREADLTGGMFEKLEKNGSGYHGVLKGPDHPFLKQAKPLLIPFRLETNGSSGSIIRIQGQAIELKPDQLTPWIRVRFRAGLGISIQGIFQCCLMIRETEISLYVSPIHIDPLKPAVPISWPMFYSGYLGRLLGTYATLGLSEDTWALNENVLSESVFWEQVCRYHEERESQLFHTLAKRKKGLSVCVFDATDRIQHMFFRYRVEDHPATRGREPSEYSDAIERIYIKADETLGKVMEKVSEDTLLVVLSDHGFKPFIRGVNLNTWLMQNGYLVLEDEENRDYLQSVDWTRTRAYAIGLAGIYLNLKGREKKGIVRPGEEAKRVKNEMIRGLTELRDEEGQRAAIRKVYDADDLYRGPYRNDAPDLIVGYHVGYRVSWDGAVGKVSKEVIEDNARFWSGDHGIDPELVPGVLFSNFAIDSGNPQIMDIAPTLLHAMGVDPPAYMEGKALKIIREN